MVVDTKIIGVVCAQNKRICDKRNRITKVSQKLLGATVLIAVCLVNSSQCTAKDTISWDELGVSLAAKSPSTSSKDVKIFVSPQRRQKG